MLLIIALDHSRKGHNIRLSARRASLLEDRYPPARGVRLLHATPRRRCGWDDPQAQAHGGGEQ